MIFARYKGAAVDGFTPGKTYIARPEMEGSSVVGFGFLEIRDDSDRLFRVYPEKGQFDFLEEVYIVALRKTEFVKSGEVLVVDDAEDTPMKTRLRVKGRRWVDSKDYQILDRTNMGPGVVVCDKGDGAWVRVSRTDEALWIVTERDSSPCSNFRPPDEFLFPVSVPEDGGAGELLYEPLVTCLMAPEGDLTVGKRYRLVRTCSGGLWAVLNDYGEERDYLAERFRMG